MLGPALVTTEGYSAAEVGETYQRALELSRRFETPNIFALLSGAWVFQTVRGDLKKARRFSLDFLTAAERDPTPGLLLAGNFMVGSNLYHLGELEASLDHMTTAFRSHDGPAESVLALFAGPDSASFAALTWPISRGTASDGNHADDHAAEAIAAAGRMRHPFSQAIALDYAAMLHVFQGRKPGGARTRPGSRGPLQGTRLRVLPGDGEHPDRLGESRGGRCGRRACPNFARDWKALRGLGAELRLPYYCALLAETLGRAGQVGEALASLSTGFAFATKNGEEWAVAELHRVQGDLLTAEGKHDAARASYEQGIEAARRSGSLAFERRLLTLAGGTAKSASTERF